MREKIYYTMYNEFDENNSIHRVMHSRFDAYFSKRDCVQIPSLKNCAQKLPRQ